MSTIIRLKCDKCGTESPLVHYGTPSDARVKEFHNGWFYDISGDECPVCTGRNPNYNAEEPF